MYAILHIPSGEYLLKSIDKHEPYKDTKEKVEETLLWYFDPKNPYRSERLTGFIPHIETEYFPTISEFEIIEVD
jgi:hypothetical protein